MTEDELKTEVDRIIAEGGDDEMAHSDEDKLHQVLIDQFCPQWVQDEIARLNEADFSRWCA